MKRYQLYNRLMEVCFWVSAFVLAWIVLARVSPFLLGYMQPFRNAVRMVMNVDVLLAMFLVTARFIRDEYAEQIWQRTARRFVNFIVVGPLGLIIVIVLFSKQIRANAQSLMPDDLLKILLKDPDPTMIYFAGIATTLVLVAQFVPLLFILFYKWSLWRDSR